LSKEQRAKNKEQRTRSKEQGEKNKEKRTRSKEQGAKTINVGQFDKFKNYEHKFRIPLEFF
jgi:hypothetical protein